MTNKDLKLNFSLDSDDKKQLQELFDKLDQNKDGKIDFFELQDYLKNNNGQKSVNLANKNLDNNNNNNKQASATFSADHATVLFNKIKGDTTQSSDNTVNFDFRDFVDYVSTTDRKIELIFKDLDVDQNGIIDKTEIKNGFEKLGIILDDKQIEKLLEHLDKNKSLQIDWKEWRDFFRFAPHDKMEELLRYWRTDSFVDYADQSIPNDYTKKEKETGLWWRNLVAGGLAGAVSRTCTAPLDRVRIYLQVHGIGTKIGMIGSLKGMVKEGGLTSLWRGNFMNVIKITPESAIKFTAYEQIKKLMGQEGQQLPPFQKFLSGTLAGFTAQTTIYPMEVLKTRMALRKTGQYNGIGDCIRKIYKHEGLSAFYRGYIMNTLGIAGVGVDFAIYETLKNQYKIMYPESTQPSIFALLAIANTSSTIAMFSTYPLFLIRTRMQSSTNKKDNIFTIGRNVFIRDGFLGFYKGSLANLAKVAPAASIGYITYEHFSKLLGVQRTN